MKMIKMLFTTLTCAAVVASSASAWDWPGTFVQATTDNTVAAYGGDWYSPTYVFNDHKWSPLTIGGDLGAFYSQGSWTENTPKLKTTVNGLNASSTYAVYVVYDKVYLGSNCNIVAGLDPSSMIWFWNYLTPAGQIRADGDYAVFSAPLGSVTGVSSLPVYIDDGDYNFGEGTRYIGLVLAETPAVPEPSSILALAGGLMGVCGLVFRRRNA